MTKPASTLDEIFYRRRNLKESLRVARVSMAMTRSCLTTVQFCLRGFRRRRGHAWCEALLADEVLFLASLARAEIQEREIVLSLEAAEVELDGAIEAELERAAAAEAERDGP